MPQLSRTSLLSHPIGYTAAPAHTKIAETKPKLVISFGGEYYEQGQSTHIKSPPGLKEERPLNVRELPRLDR